MFLAQNAEIETTVNWPILVCSSNATIISIYLDRSHYSNLNKSCVTLSRSEVIYVVTECANVRVDVFAMLRETLVGENRW